MLVGLKKKKKGGQVVWPGDKVPWRKEIIHLGICSFMLSCQHVSRPGSVLNQL